MIRKLFGFAVTLILGAMMIASAPPQDDSDEAPPAPEGMIQLPADVFVNSAPFAPEAPEEPVPPPPPPGLTAAEHESLILVRRAQVKVTAAAARFREAQRYGEVIVAKERSAGSVTPEIARMNERFDAMVEEGDKLLQDHDELMLKAGRLAKLPPELLVPLSRKWKAVAAKEAEKLAREKAAKQATASK